MDDVEAAVQAALYSAITYKGVPSPDQRGEFDDMEQAIRHVADVARVAALRGDLVCECYVGCRACERHEHEPYPVICKTHEALAEAEARLEEK